MLVGALPGRLSQVEFDGELPVRQNLSQVFDELDYQMACQVYLWALPLVSYAQWQQQHRDVFGATSSDLVRYVSYRDRLGLITANATTPYILGFFDLTDTGRWSSSFRRGRRRAASRTSGSARSARWARWARTPGRAGRT
jgi:hypothetical protein